MYRQRATALHRFILNTQHIKNSKTHHLVVQKNSKTSLLWRSTEDEPHSLQEAKSEFDKKATVF
jgi:hypothetical protein